jgi:hypothetical protein
MLLPVDTFSHSALYTYVEGVVVSVWDMLHLAVNIFCVDFLILAEYV